jgi:hypothetical protein
MEIVGLMWWSTGNNVQFIEFHISRHPGICTELWGDRSFPMSKCRMWTTVAWRRWCGSNAVKPKCVYTQNLRKLGVSQPQELRILHRDVFCQYPLRSVQRLSRSVMPSVFHLWQAAASVQILPDVLLMGKIKLKVKLSHYRPRQARRPAGGRGC